MLILPFGLFSFWALVFRSFRPKSSKVRRRRRRWMGIYPGPQAFGLVNEWRERDPSGPTHPNPPDRPLTVAVAVAVAVAPPPPLLGSPGRRRRALGTQIPRRAKGHAACVPLVKSSVPAGRRPGPPPYPEPTSSGRLVGHAAPPRFRVKTTPLLGRRSSISES
jgi:hypothetical protein